MNGLSSYELSGALNNVQVNMATFEPTHHSEPFSEFQKRSDTESTNGSGPLAGLYELRSKLNKTLNEVVVKDNLLKEFVPVLVQELAKTNLGDKKVRDILENDKDLETVVGIVKSIDPKSNEKFANVQKFLSFYMMTFNQLADSQDLYSIFVKDKKEKLEADVKRAKESNEKEEDKAKLIKPASCLTFNELLLKYEKSARNSATMYDFKLIMELNGGRNFLESYGSMNLVQLLRHFLKLEDQKEGSGMYEIIDAAFGRKGKVGQYGGKGGSNNNNNNSGNRGNAKMSILLLASIASSAFFAFF